MAFSSWRGIVGMVHPTLRPGATEETIRLLPEGIGVLPLFLNIRRGVRDEFKEVFPGYETQVALLSQANCDTINVAGAPPFMVQGRDAETRITRDWEDKYGVSIFTSGQNHVAALRALGAKSIIGATYFPGEINQSFARYFEDAGIAARCMEGIETPFDKAQELSGEQVYAHIKKHFLKHKGADAIYMLGSGWRTLHIVETLEQDLQVPVIHPVPARVWEFQKRLHVNEPQEGYGYLLENLPALPSL
jgi:maleate isomerase